MYVTKLVSLSQIMKNTYRFLLFYPFALPILSFHGASGFACLDALAIGCRKLPHQVGHCGTELANSLVDCREIERLDEGGGHRYTP